MSEEQFGADLALLTARLVDAVQQSVIATDLSGTVIFWNNYATRMFGWTRDEALGKSIFDLTPHESTREEAIAIMDRLSRGESWAGEFPVRRKDGTSFIAFVVDSPILDADGQLVGIVGVSTDVSTQRAIETQLRQAKKMEAVGRLAAGVAHDFNNLLTVILGNVELLRETEAHHVEMLEGLAEVYDAASRAATLTRQLLTFSRKQLVRPIALDLPAALRMMLPMLRRLIGEDIEITLELGDERLSTVLDPGEFDQVVLNLALNARDGMPAGGKLVIRIDCVAGASIAEPPAPTGPLVRMTVSDTGIGIPAEMLAHIFEPFFTTKTGTGTGLGLATVKSIVEGAGGTLGVVSSERGTTFSIFFPRTSDSEPAAISKPASSPSPNRKTIMVVEDEQALRKLAARVLRSAGFEVLTSENGLAALELASAHEGTIDLLLTDLVMPGMNGITLMEQVRSLRPNIAVLLMTGYSPEDLLRRGAATLPTSHLLRKPFVPAQLLAAVDDAFRCSLRGGG